MRKLLFVGVIAASTMVSCGQEKDYYCECRISERGRVIKTVLHYERISGRARAKKWCSRYNNTTIEGSSTSTSKTKCELK